jgi:hypothetical protein
MTTAQQKYEQRMRAAGYSQLRLWVPPNCRKYIKQLVADMRLLDDLGIDPLKKLPASIRPSKRRGAA